MGTQSRDRRRADNRAPPLMLCETWERTGRPWGHHLTGPTRDHRGGRMHIRDARKVDPSSGNLHICTATPWGGLRKQLAG